MDQGLQHTVSVKEYSKSILNKEVVIAGDLYLVPISPDREIGLFLPERVEKGVYRPPLARNRTNIEEAREKADFSKRWILFKNRKERQDELKYMEKSEEIDREEVPEEIREYLLAITGSNVEGGQ